MATGQNQIAADYSARYRGARSGKSNGTAERLANGLGWFSVGLGLAEVVAPGALANLIGLRDEPKTRAVLRTYGIREITQGIGILSRHRPVGWVWGRVAGDALDIASLSRALGSRGTNKARAATATAAVLGVTALDIVCGQQLSAETGNGAHRRESGKVTRTIIVDRPAEQAYQFWHNFENLPTFMTYVESVRKVGDGRTHWAAKGPGGKRVEWDAQTVVDEPNRLIAWRSVDGSSFVNSGAVRFDRAPGDRGTLVSVELQYAPRGGVLASTVGKVLGAHIGQRVQHDLRNFKQMLEVGEVTQSDASIHEGMYPAQPPESRSGR